LADYGKKSEGLLSLIVRPKLTNSVCAISADEYTTCCRGAVFKESSDACLMLFEPLKALSILDVEVVGEPISQLRPLDTYELPFLGWVFMA
jgi:hypothetical protein